MRFKVTARTMSLVTLAGFGLLLVIGVGGIAVLATLIGSPVTLITVPLLWLSGNRHRAGKLPAGWEAYMAFSICGLDWNGRGAGTEYTSVPAGWALRLRAHELDRVAPVRVAVLR